jgi:hypothetical protein
MTTTQQSPVGVSQATIDRVIALDSKMTKKGIAAELRIRPEVVTHILAVRGIRPKRKTARKRPAQSAILPTSPASIGSIGQESQTRRFYAANARGGYSLLNWHWLATRSAQKQHA